MAGKGAKKKAKREKVKAKDEKGWQKRTKRKVCIFCVERIPHVDYKDTGLLRKFVSERGKIRARRVSGNCVQHQHDVASAVKNAREMALLPYSSR
jgi:ribosomal protein S18